MVTVGNQEIHNFVLRLLNHVGGLWQYVLRILCQDYLLCAVYCSLCCH